MLSKIAMRHALLAVFAALALGACSKAADKTASAPTTTTSTTVTTTATAAAPVASGLPVECEAYFKRVNTCVEKLGASSPFSAQFKTSMDTMRAQWSSISDKAALSHACKQATDGFNQTSAQMGCTGS
jgi:hypothetical protein